MAGVLLRLNGGVRGLMPHVHWHQTAACNSAATGGRCYSLNLSFMLCCAIAASMAVVIVLRDCDGRWM